MLRARRCGCVVACGPDVRPRSAVLSGHHLKIVVWHMQSVRARDAPRRARVRRASSLG
jgi:hypothetical protein